MEINAETLKTETLKMRAISLWQPFASAVAVGAKRIETRSWATKYRGPLAIHAAKRCVVEELISYWCSWTWKGALRPIGFGGKKVADFEWESCLPFGAIVATCELVDCRPTGSFTLEEIQELRMPEGETLSLYGWTEEQLGDFSLGRFGWVLENVRALPVPVPWKGSQGFFEVTLP